ncbi:MAG: protein translocase subunit SecD [Candidatus Omnitrophica bacterium]|nr:protein translocase subunit SecD [Candidatus Omnitrophota bacterium]
MKNHYIRLSIIAAIIGLCIWAIYPVQQKIKEGLDLKGGVHIVLQVERPPNIPNPNMSDITNRALEIIRNRVDALGVVEPSIEKSGINRIIVDLPGVKEPQQAIKIIGKTALLEFDLVNDNPQKISEALSGKVPEGYQLLYSERKNASGMMEKSSPLLVKTPPELTGADLSDAQVGYSSSGFPVVNLTFNSKGTTKFSNVTSENVGKRLAIVLDGIVQSAPVIREAIPNGNAQISGNFSLTEAKNLALVLKAGALPAKVKIIYKEIIGPSLGKQYIHDAIHAALWGSIVVVIFMIVYYSAFGFLADFALALNILMLLAVMAVFKGTLTLPGIAGIALTIGMSVDANILIFERIREELKLGKSARGAIDAGYHRAWSAIIDSHITTIIAGIILFYLGAGPIKGFGFTLTVGIAANLLTAVFITKSIVDYIVASKGVEKVRI